MVHRGSSKYGFGFLQLLM